MTTYCYAHGLVEGGCNSCQSKVNAMLRGDPPYRKGIPAVDAYRCYFPQAHETPATHEG